MGLKIRSLFILIILILLQSCSGGRIGNFLESSFKNIDETKIKKENKNNIKSKIVINSEGDVENKDIKKIITNENIKNNIENQLAKEPDGNPAKNKNIKKTITNENIKNNRENQLVINPEETSKNNKKIMNRNISRQKRKYQPQSYKIIFILKDVDPKDPIEDLSTILRNSDVNFEIEKIERFFDPKNKNIKKN